MIMPDKGLVSRMYKELSKLNKKTELNLKKNCRDWNRHITKKIYGK